jgi:hypothetical protein
MNQEQFGQFWQQLRTPLKAKWEKITTEDIDEIKGDHKEEVTTWANRRYSTWTGNYVGYRDAEEFLALHKEIA